MGRLKIMHNDATSTVIPKGKIFNITFSVPAFKFNFLLSQGETSKLVKATPYLVFYRDRTALGYTI